MAEYIRALINRLFYTPTGQLIISAIFGLALALLFRRVCKDNCTKYFAPYLDEIEGTVFKLEDTCYEYMPYPVECNDKALMSYDVNTVPINKINKL